MSSTRWVALQILSIRRTSEPERFNPRPCGVMQSGSATEAVWSWLLARPRCGWWSRGQIVAGTGRTGKSVDWALLFLRSTGKVIASSDEARNARYLRYQAVRED